ncbi:MAG TPA: arginine--tRNA ligase [Candidatus Magasanikbacteria bacterium]|nr:arginine--tRNA ligase [Candidatus Magasanikbacteria bacterium]
MCKVHKQVENLLKKSGIKGEVFFSVPPNPEMGDLAYPCFDLAKSEKTNPAETAKNLAEKINGNLSKFVLVEKVVNYGPYVNFYFNTGEYARLILDDIVKKGKKFGLNKNGKNKKVLVEYPSNNTHKELHIGHLRNICLGNSLANLFEINGYNVVRVNYLNDFGAHVAKCLWGLLKFHNKEKPPKNRQKWLGEIYAEASRYLKDHPEAADEVAIMQQKMEAKDKSIWPLYLQTKQWSVEGFEKAFKDLKVVHKSVFYEKETKHVGQKMVDKLLKNKIAQVGEGGAIIADLTKYGLDIALLRKSNGAGLYLTSDLGLAVAKNKKYKATESIHLTSVEQNFYFKQLFKILELAGYKYKMTHIGYGLVTLPSGKMASREGNVILYEDLYKDVFERIYQETIKRHGDWSKKKIEETVKKISLGAIKFDILKHEAQKSIVFDPDGVISFDGFTGPYVIYTVARINSLLNKGKKCPLQKVDYGCLKNQEEKRLIKCLADYQTEAEKAFKNYNPSVIVKYCFDTAKAFNDFYTKVSVLKTDDEKIRCARLSLCLAVKIILQNSLNILSIDTVEEM